MLYKIKTVAKRALSSMLTARTLRSPSRGPLVILMYHGVIDRPMSIPDPCMVDLDSFRSQMQYLKKHFDVVSMTAAVDLLRNDTITRPTAVITFDDGYQNNFNMAYPVLLEENLPATIFLTTQFIDSDTTIWTGLLQNAFIKSPKEEIQWRGHRFDISTGHLRREALATIKQLFKGSTQESLMDNVSSVITELSNGNPIELDADSPYRMLDSESIRKLNQSNLIEFGGHTHSHYILSQIPTSLQEAEIRKSLEHVAELTGSPCDFFAYPNGQKHDYNDDSLAILKNSGIKAALTTQTGTCDSKMPILELKRIAVSDDTDMSSFVLSLFNVPNRFRALLAMNE